jgi:hypothetical protein
LIINDLTSPSTVWDISASGTTYDGTIGALSLTTQFIEADTQIIDTGNGPATIAGWVNINQYTGGANFNCLPAVGTNTNGQHFRQFPLYGATVNAIKLGNVSNVLSGTGYVYGNTESPINTWVLVVIKKKLNEQTTSFRPYINNFSDFNQAGGFSYDGDISYTGTNSFGLINGTKFGGTSFPISVSQFWMYNSELSNADILDLYNTTRSRYIPLPAVTGLSNGRRFGQGFPQ